MAIQEKVGSLNEFASQQGLDLSKHATIHDYSSLLSTEISRPEREFPKLDYVLAGTIEPMVPVEEREEYQGLRRR